MRYQKHLAVVISVPFAAARHIDDPSLQLTNFRDASDITSIFETCNLRGCYPHWCWVMPADLIGILAPILFGGPNTFPRLCRQRRSSKDKTDDQGDDTHDKPVSRLCGHLWPAPYGRKRLLGDTFTLRLTAGMLVTEAMGTDESTSPTRVSGACHHGTCGSGRCGAV